MKTNLNYTRHFFVLLFFLSSFLLITQTGCKKKDDNISPVPTKFTELKIDPAFQFDNFVTLNVTIGVLAQGTPAMSVIKIFEGDPKSNGKTITMGATDASGQFKTSLRVPSRLTNLWVGNISATGINEYVEVPIRGNTFTYIFGQSNNKSTLGSSANDCNTGTVISANGEYSIASGQTYVVLAGANLTNLKLNISSNGTVRICGTANITKIDGTGKLIISPSGYATIPVEHIHCKLENYGNLNCAQSGNNKNFLIEDDGLLTNWGTITMSNGLNVKGTLINNYHLTVVEDAETNGSGKITNNCQMFVNATTNEAFKITTGSSSVPGFTNGTNAYLKVNGRSIFSGQGHISLGLQSLIETGSFEIQGYFYGPSSQGSQVHALGSSNKVAGGHLSGYIDFWASSINPKNGTFGANITWHNPGYVIVAQNCSAATAPNITSSLSAAGMVGVPITPYTITASGTAPITFNATNLPAGLTFNPSTGVISGTPTEAVVKNVPLTADNFMGTDTETLQFSIIAPGEPPVITSALTALSTVNQPYSYFITATSQSAVTYLATNLPAGLQFNASTHEIYGTPTSTGVFNIPLTATNTNGTDQETLVLTIGAPPAITSPLTAIGTTGQQFSTYTVTASGSGTISYGATNLPAGLTFDDDYNTINGTPSFGGVVNVTLSATNQFGSDTKVLAITINEPAQTPRINSTLSALAFLNQPFTYQLSASGTNPITFNATNLPAGLTFSAEFGVISGVPTVSGTFNITLTATNSAGTDTKTLVLTVPQSTPVQTDTDNDGIPDPLDAYPTDGERAFNSFYPNEVDYATYAFEDLWPAYGDYDFNDLVVNFNYKIITNAENKVVDLVARFKVKAAGASYNNGFGVSFDVNPDNVESVTGCIKVGTAVTIDAKGYESGHTNNTVIIPVDAVNSLLGRSMINTIEGGYAVQTEEQTVTMHLSTPQLTIGVPPYNPFMFINQDRGKEVHLKDHAPTQLANPVYFGTLDDATNPGSSFYYRSASGLPWGLEIPVDFQYPVEKADILQTYLRFAAWAQSSGANYPDWYMNNPGYRNSANIY